MWYTFTSSSHGHCTTASTERSDFDFDTVLAVYEGSDCDNLTCVAENDDRISCEESCKGSGITWVPSAETTYKVLVAGKSEETGRFGLDISVRTMVCIGIVAFKPSIDLSNLLCGRKNNVIGVTMPYLLTLYLFLAHIITSLQIPLKLERWRNVSSSRVIIVVSGISFAILGLALASPHLQSEASLTPFWLFTISRQSFPPEAVRP